MVEQIIKQLHALSYFWLDLKQLNDIYRYKTEKYSHCAVNKFNVTPDSLPERIFNYMSSHRGLFVGNVSPRRMDFSWFAIGFLPCYKSHSVQCTESFMGENVNDELRQVRSDDQTKTKMLEILKRFHEEDGVTDSITDDEGLTLPEEIFQKIMNGDEVSLDDLSLEERKGFQRALASGELSKMIEPWDPWWLRASARTISLGVGGTQLVQCVEDEEEEEEATVVSEIPRGPDTPLISLSKLSSNPSPQLVNSAYKNLGGGLKFGLNLVDNVICLLSLGSGAIVCLLCDLQRLILGAIQEVKSSSGRDLKKKLKLAERKVFFMMFWINEQSSEVWQALESSLRAEKNLVVERNDCKGVPKMKKKDQFRKGGGVVIEEIE